MLERAIVAVVVVLAILAAACGPSDDGAGDGRVRVVASFYPLAEAAERVGGELIGVENLTPPGVEPHDLELTPRDLEAIVSADLVLVVGGGFQPAVEDALADAEGVVVDALERVEALPPPADGAAEELAADPHVWLDPMLYAAIVAQVGDVLAERLPDDAETFRANAAVFIDELRVLDAEFRDGLAGCRSRMLVVNHAAFGYLAKAYDLRQEAISGISPESEPDPARLAELKDLVTEQGITTIFTEELASPEVARTLADEAGVRTAVLDPLEGLTPMQLEAGEDYLSVMRENLRTLRSGLGCA